MFVFVQLYPKRSRSGISSDSSDTGDSDSESYSM